MTDIQKFILHLLRTGRLSGVRLGVAEWFELCGELHSHGLLMRFAGEIENEAPLVVASRVEEMHVAHLEKMNQRLVSLGCFDAEAQRVNLKYVLFKGMADSLVLYGDLFIRDSGDIDILVDEDDLSKADYAARKAGWVQPGEAYRVRRALDEHNASADKLLQVSHPYSLRSSRFLPHVTNHYFVHENCQIDSMEIHDRFHGLSSAQCSSSLWSAHSEDIGNLTINVLSPVAGFVFSALSLYEDSESIRSNTSNAGDLGFKTCEDLHSWLVLLDRECLYEEALELIRFLGVSRKVAVSLAALLELHPEDAYGVELLGGTEESVWSLPYLERVFDPSERALSAVNLLHAKVVDSCGSLKGNSVAYREHRRTLPAYGSCLASPFGFGINGSFADGHCILNWYVPSELTGSIDSLVFQAVVVLNRCSQQGLGYRINCFCEDGTWEARVIPMGVNSVDGHANKVKRGRSCSVEVKTVDKGLHLRLTLELPYDEIALCLSSVNNRIYGQLFRVCAGWDFIEEASKLMGV